jgi:anti-sigma B factor antagonist
MGIASWSPTGALTVYEATANWERIKQVTADAGRVEVDLSAVAEVDSTGVQLLIMAKRICDQCGAELLLRSCSEPVREAMRLYGYGSHPVGDELPEVVCP